MYIDVMAELHESDHNSGDVGGDCGHETGGQGDRSGTAYLAAVEDHYWAIKSEAAFDQTVTKLADRVGIAFLAALLDNIEAGGALRQRCIAGLPATLPAIYHDVVAGHLAMWEADRIRAQTERARLLNRATAEVDEYLALQDAASKVSRSGSEKSPARWQLNVLSGERGQWVRADERKEQQADLRAEPIADVG